MHADRSFKSGGGCDGRRWPSLLTDYQSALENFERITKTLTLVLVDRTSSAEDVRRLIESESRARDLVILTRMRLMNAWREAQPDFDLPTGFPSTPRARK